MSMSDVSQTGVGQVLLYCYELNTCRAVPSEVYDTFSNAHTACPLDVECIYVHIPDLPTSDIAMICISTPQSTGLKCHIGLNQSVQD